MVSVRKSRCNVMKKKKGAQSKLTQKKSISKTRKAKTNVKQEVSCGKQTQKQLNVWDFYYDEEQRNFSGKIKFWGDIDVPYIICAKLNSDQMEMLKETPFGQFINVGKRRLFTQIIHQGLIREIHQTQESEIWFLFGEERSRFSLAEFCLISGLKGSGNTDLAEYEGVENSFISKYFSEVKVTRSLIRKKFDEAVFESNEEAIRLAFIFFVFNYLLATVEENSVDLSLLKFLSCGDIKSFPWGKIGFESLIKKSLRTALKGNVRKVDRGVFEYNFYKESDCRFYKLSGLVYVFQVFLFETIIDLKQKGFCTDDQQSSVRLFKWTELGKLPQMKKLRNNVFGTRKMSVRLLVPTSEEKGRFELDEFQFPDIPSKNDSTEEENKKQKSEPLNISEIKELIDSRVKPITRKMKRMRKEVREMKIKVRTEMNEFMNDVKTMVDEAFQKILIALKVDGQDRNTETGYEFANRDSAASKSERKDVSKGHTYTYQCSTETEHAAEKEKSTGLEVIDKESAEIQHTGMEVVLYTPEQIRIKVDVQKVDVGFDMNFTTQELNQIDEVVRSFSKGRRRPVRAVKKSHVLRTPYTTNIRSRAAQSKVTAIKKPLELISAFPTECMQMLSSTDNSTFDVWFKIGLNKRKKYEKIPGLADVITPPFTFGGVKIKSKMWFHRLLTPGQYMDNNHIDVCFYYLRKLAKYSMQIPIRVTTTDCWFHAILSGLYKSFNDHDGDETILTSDDHVVRYIQGTTMRANTSSAYVGVSECDHIELEIAEELPEQVDSDCGMFTIGYAEHYIHQKIHQIPQPFPVPSYRKKLAANLYLYAHQKLSAEHDSGTE